MPILLRHAHQVGDDLQGELGRDLLDEVSRSGLAHAVDDRVGGGDHPGFEVPDHPRGETLVDQTPVAGVHRRVHVEHHHPLLGQALFVHVGEQGCRPVGREVFVVAIDRDAVVVAGHRPEPLGESFGVRMPLDRGLTAEVGEPLVGDTIDEVGRVTQVDVGLFHGLSPCRPGHGRHMVLAFDDDDVSRTCISYHRPAAP
jgi:hypothetical protein